MNAHGLRSLSIAITALALLSVFLLREAKATTFDITGSFSSQCIPPGCVNTTSVTQNFSGQLTISGGSVTSAELTSPGFSTMDQLVPFQGIAVGNLYFFDVTDGHSADFELIFSVPDPTNLDSYTGGAIFQSTTLNICSTDPCDFLQSIAHDYVNASGTITATPLPAALPLFATGLGGLGLLGWRRKRKAQAVA